MVSRSYLEVALEEYQINRNAQAFFMAFKEAAKAQGGLTELAKKSNLNRQNLYKILSGDRKPRLETVSHLIHGLGYKFSLEVIQ